MAKKKLDIGDFLKAPEGVSGSNTEQIVLIELDRIDPDPDNFYSLDGLDALAGNIELIGLQQPLRVRPNGERFIIVSGHRRRAAIQLIRDGGSQQFSAGVPCIVEYGEASEAMRKLRLIYANAATRVMTSAEISRQAEEVQRLLYELKEQGVEFPGRMRDHVAEACKISASKLARLHAIRANLDSNLLIYFDRGDLNEDAAYKLTQLPAEIQFAVGQELVNGRRKKCPSGVVVDAVLRNLKGLQEAEMKCRAHAGGPDCHHRKERIVRSIFAQYDWNICTPGKCCMDCRHAAEGCAGACREAKDKVKLDKTVEEEKRGEREKTAQTERERQKAAVVRRCKQLAPLLDVAGLKDEDRIFDGYEAAKAGDVRQWARDGAVGKTFYSTTCVEPWRVEDLKSFAKKCKLDKAALLEGKIKSAQAEARVYEADDLSDEEDEIYVSARKWGHGKPPAAGLYAVRFKVSETAPGELHNFAAWDGFQWKAVRSGKVVTDLIAAAWFPLPDLEEKEGKA